MILTIILAFFSLIALVTLHEFGHFIAAKRFGVKVEEFGIGYPPRIIGKKIGETIYSLNWLPFGAFVKMPGEIEQIEDADSFFKKSVWQRMIIVVAGVFTFWVVSFFIFSFVPTGVAISGIATSSPASLAGLQPLDIIQGIKADGVNYQVVKISDAQKVINANKGKEITLNILRDRQEISAAVTPRISPPAGQGSLGIGLAYGAAKRNYPLYQAFPKGFQRTMVFTGEIVTGFGQAALNASHGQPTGVDVMGPVGIFQLFAESLKQGSQYFFLLLALISLYMSIFNILPIPALDGGKLLFLIIEAIRKKPISQKIEQNITTACFGLLILLMIFVTVKDVIKLF
jgi:regulator of sigma E protease